MIRFGVGVFLFLHSQDSVYLSLSVSLLHPPPGLQLAPLQAGEPVALLSQQVLGQRRPGPQESPSPMSGLLSVLDECYLSFLPAHFGINNRIASVVHLTSKL